MECGQGSSPATEIALSMLFLCYLSTAEPYLPRPEPRLPVTINVARAPAVWCPLDPVPARVPSPPTPWDIRKRFFTDMKSGGELRVGQACQCSFLVDINCSKLQAGVEILLMENGSLEPKRPKATSYWGHGCDTGHVDAGHTEYLTRLTSLRDSLIKQEQLYLARAIDRLRMQSLTNKSSSDRLRMNLPDCKKPTSTATRPSMMTTVEKFRQMRPQLPKPVIQPLVGKQLLVGNAMSSSDELLTFPEGSALNMGPVDTVNHTTSQATLSKEDNIVVSNLLRLSQTTCSIPNIGRKTRTNQECIQPKTKSMCKQKGRLFLPFQNSKSLSSSMPSCETTKITARNLETGSSAFPLIYPCDGWKRDAYNTDYDNDEEEGDQTNRKRILNNRSDINEHRRNSENTENCRERDRGYLDRPQTFSKMRPHNGQRTFYSQSRPKKRKDADFMSSIGHALYSYRNSPAVQHVNGDVPSVDGRLTEYIHGVIQLLPDRSYRASIKNGIVYVHGIEDESDAETLDYTDTRDPYIEQCDNDTTVLRGASHNHPPAASTGKVSVQDIPVTSVQHRAEMPLDTNKESHLSNKDQYVDDNKTQKKHIIVDMPKIIFNAASPAQDLDDSIDEDLNETQQSHVLQSPLRKVIQQQQVRIRELTNLLEDVKELSLKTEAMKLQSAT